VNVAVCAVLWGYGEGQLLGMVNEAVWAVSFGYGEGQLLGTGECVGMGNIERLWRGTFGGQWLMWRYGLYLGALDREILWALVNVAVWAV
jgi:hypothetical protein